MHADLNPKKLIPRFAGVEVAEPDGIVMDGIDLHPQIRAMRLSRPPTTPTLDMLMSRYSAPWKSKRTAQPSVCPPTTTWATPRSDTMRSAPDRYLHRAQSLLPCPSNQAKCSPPTLRASLSKLSRKQLDTPFHRAFLGRKRPLAYRPSQGDDCPRQRGGRQNRPHP